MLEITADRQDIGKIRNRGAGVEVVCKVSYRYRRNWMQVRF